MKKYLITMCLTLQVVFILAQNFQPFQQSAKWGFKNEKGVIIQTPIFDTVWVEPFANDGMALYGDKKLIGIVNLKGEWVSRPDTNIVKEANFFRMYFSQEPNFEKSNQEILSNVFFVYGFKVEVNKLFYGDSVLLFDSTCANYVELKGKSSDFPYAGKFLLFNGFSKKITKEPVENIAFLLQPFIIIDDFNVICSWVGFKEFQHRKNYFSYINLLGSIDYFNRYGSFFIETNNLIKNEVFPVKYNGKWGWINKQGEWLMPAEYDSVHYSRFYRHGVLSAIFDLRYNEDMPLYKVDEKLVNGADDYLEISLPILNDDYFPEYYFNLYLYLYDSQAGNVQLLDSVRLLDLNCNVFDTVLAYNKRFFTKGKIRLVHPTKGLVSESYFDNIYKKTNFNIQVENLHPLCFETVFAGYRETNQFKWLPLITSKDNVLANRAYYIEPEINPSVTYLIGQIDDKYFVLSFNDEKFLVQPLNIPLDDSLLTQIYVFLPTNERMILKRDGKIIMMTYSGKIIPIAEYIAVWEHNGKIIVETEIAGDEPKYFYGTIDKDGKPVIPVKYSYDDLMEKIGTNEK